MQPTNPLSDVHAYLKSKDKDFTADLPTFEQDMQDDEVRQQVYDYLKGQDKDFTASFDEFSQDMGLKKKPLGDAGSTPTEQLASPAGALPEGDTEFAAQPQVLPLGYQLPGAPLPEAEQAADAEAARVYAPGFTGPVPAGTYERPSDKGTPQQGTQYFGEQQPAAPEAADVADDGFWASLGKSLYNGLDPKRIGGNLLDYGGDLLEVLGRSGSLGAGSARGMAVPSDSPTIAELSAPLTNDKYSDVKGADLLAAAQAGDLPLSQAAQASAFANPSLAAFGNLAGSGIASIIPVAAASAVGGPLAGAGVGGALGISSTKDAARAAGIDDKEAAITATMLAPIQAALEALGVSDPGVSKLAIRATLREALAAGGGKLTTQALGAAAKKVIPELADRALSGALHEAPTEFLQGIAEGEARIAADALRGNQAAPAGQGRYGTTQEEVFRSAAEQTAAGALLGGGVGVTHGGAIVDVVRPTGQVELRGAEVVGQYDPASGTVTVRAPDAQGNWQQVQVPTGWVKPTQGAPAATATSEQVQPAAPEVQPALATQLAEPEVAPAEEAPAPLNEPAPATPTPASPVSPEPSPAEAPAAIASPPDAASGPPTATEPESPRSQPLPEAAPEPASVKALTPQQQATNAALDGLDRYNALDARAKKGKPGSAIRAEISTAAQKAGLSATVGKDFSMSVTRDGKRATRFNEYTATTPAANHVPLESRPAEARPFMDSVLSQAEADPRAIQGMGIKVRGKELSARELAGAVEDIRAGKNTLRAQLVLDSLENAHRRGYVEKSEGTGLSTRKFTVPIEDYIGDVAQPQQTPVELSDPELDQLIADDPKVRQAVDDYIRPDGSVDYQKLADEENALPFLFELSEESSAKLAAYARERAQQPTREARPAAPQSGTEPRSEAQGPAGVDEAAPAGGAEVASLLAPSEEKKAQIRAEIDAASQRIKERRAARKREGKVLSSPLPIGEIDVEDLKDALAIARGHVQLGVLGVKNLIAQIRAAGLSEEDASDAALTPRLRELLTGEPAPELPANEPDGSATRRSMERFLNDDTVSQRQKDSARDSGLDKYEPKSLAETEQAVDAYLSRNSLNAAYIEAISDNEALRLDVRTALRVRVLKSLGQQLTEAIDKGDISNADAYLKQADAVTEALAKSGTEYGRGINAYKLLISQTPEAAVYKSTKEIKEQYDKEIKRLERKVKSQARQIQQLKEEALQNTLASDGVRGVRDQVTGTTRRRTTRENIQAVRARRADLFAELSALSRQKPAVAYVSVVPITPQMAKAAEIHIAIFRTYIREGLLEVKALVERIRKDGGPALAQVPRKQLEASATEALRLAKVDDAVYEGVKDLGTTVEQIARDFLKDPESVGKTLAQQFVEKAGLSGAEAKTYADAIEKEFARRIARAQQARLDELNNRAAKASEPAKRKLSQTDLDKTRELFALSPTDDAAILEHLKRVNDLPELTAQDVAELRKLAQAVQKAPEGFQRDEAVEKLLKKQASIKGVNWAEIGQAMWYANVLSGYKTHVINFTANIIQTGAEVGVNTTHALLTGKGRYAAASSKGLLKGLGRGVREAVSVLTTGRETSREPGKYEVPGILENVRFAGGAANPANYLKLVSRALRAGDVLFSGGLKEMRAYEQAVKFALEDAKSDGAPGQDIWGRAAEKLYNTQQRVTDARAQAQAEGLTGNDLARRVYEIAEQSRGAGIMEDARVYAPRAVFNGEVEGVLGVVANGIQQITEAASFKGIKPLKFIIPFTRVITNVANAYLDYTPVGGIRAWNGKHFVKEGSTTQREFTREERQKLVIKSVIGGAVMAAAFAASSSDKEDERLLEITGAGTGNPTKDAQLRADGWQPYSFKVNGTWYSYANTPIGAMLAVVGNVNDGQKYRGELLSDDDGALNTLYLGAWRAMQFTKDMTALKSATDFLTALSSRNAVDLTNYGQRLAVGTVKGFVPFSSFLTQTAKDYEMLKEQPRKQGRSFGQMLAQDIPVARNGINNALDALGDPLPVDTDRLFSSPPHRDEKTQRIWSWLNKNGLFISVPNRNSGGALLLDIHGGKEKPMTDNEYYRFMLKRGQILKSFLLSDIADLEKLSPQEAKEELQSYAKDASEQAKDEEFGESTPVGDD